MPQTDSHLILTGKSVVRNNKDLQILKIKSLQGEEALKLLNLISRTLNPLFQELNEYYKSRKGDYLDACVIDMSTKKCKRKTEKILDNSSQLAAKKK